MSHRQADASPSSLVTVTELMQLRTLGIGIGEVSWSRVRMTSDDWICIVHRDRSAAGRDDRKRLQATVVDPLGDQVRCLQLDGLMSAQVSPLGDVVAVATREKIFSVCLKTNRIISWNRFPCAVEFWTWVGEGVIGFIGRERIYHWLVDGDSLSFIVNRSPRLRNTQITNYQVDREQGWHVLQGLQSDASSFVTGVVQCYSTAHSHSTVLEADATSITACQFAPNPYLSQVLVVVSRSTSKSARISVVELGPQKADRNLLINRSETFHWPNSDDIASNIVCSPEASLVYVLSKRGMLFVFNLETCFPYIVCERVCCDLLFNVVLDKRTKGVLAAARNGQILSIHAQIANMGRVCGDEEETQSRDQITRL